MSENLFDTYIEFSYSKLNITTFNKKSGGIEHSHEKDYKIYFFNNEELKFNKLSTIVEKNILEVEKLINKFIKDVYLIIETPETTSIKLSVTKNNEGKKINKKNIMYLIQDGKQQILKLNKSISIIHIIVENYNLDNVNYKFLPLDIKCKNFSIDINFICFPKNLLENFEQLFLKQQIYINQFICSNYLKKFNFENKEQNICQVGRKIVNGFNKQEVVSIPKTIKKHGFFEKLFHFFG